MRAGLADVYIRAASLADPAADSEMKPDEALARWRADVEIFQVLTNSELRGTEWAKVSAALGAYGLGLMEGWLICGEIVERCGRVGKIVNLPEMVGSEDRYLLAGDTVRRSVEQFRTRALKASGWRANEHVTLADYFAELLCFNFPQVLATREIDRRAEPAPAAFASPEGARAPGRADSLSRADYRAASAIANPRERKTTLLKLAGYDEAEIAELLRGDDRRPGPGNRTPAKRRRSLERS
ncbi:hypothetical protein [Dactylosporangium sp. CA-139066]|uniref:hypothetical protein n=1 Tax=Dactylosporangium sp. CA-139066 TaxID=3239930 RepID=UPI003D94CD42